MSHDPNRPGDPDEPRDFEEPDDPCNSEEPDDPGRPGDPQEPDNASEPDAPDGPGGGFDASVAEDFPDLAGPLHTAAGASLDSSANAIPVLTEVIEVPRYDASELPRTLADVDWSQLALRVQENVLERLLSRSDALLDAQLQSSLQSVIGRATESLAAELHTTLGQMVRDLVARAVTDELTRVHDEVMRARGGVDDRL